MLTLISLQDFIKFNNSSSILKQTSPGQSLQARLNTYNSASWSFCVQTDFKGPLPGMEGQ